MEDGFDLKWKNHLREFFRHVGDLRRVESLSDVTLLCRDGETPFPVHKIVLAACSSFFEKVFTSTTLAGGTKVLVMAETEPEMMRLLVDFMYLGEVFVPAVDMDKFMKAAERLGIRGLTDQGAGGNEGDAENEGGSDGRVGEWTAARDAPSSSGTKRVLGEASAVSPLGETCRKKARRLEEEAGAAILSSTEPAGPSCILGADASTDTLDDWDDGSCDSDIIEVPVQVLKTEMERARDSAHIVIPKTESVHPGVGDEEYDGYNIPGTGAESSTSTVVGPAEGSSTEYTLPLEYPAELSPDHPIQQVGHSLYWRGTNINDGTSLYFCHFCAMSSKYYQSVRDHVRKQHAVDERQYECAACGGRFMTEANLMKHKCGPLRRRR